MTITEDIVRDRIAQPAPTGWLPTGRTRDAYLDVAETIVRAAAGWLDAEGAIIDPVEHEEWGQSSSRFVSSAAVLIAKGRCQDLRDVVLTAMDRCCARLADGKAESPDFWTRELMTAYASLQALEPERAHGWAADLARVIPEQIYWQVEQPDTPIESLHNWTIYAAAGEAMRAQAGLGPKQDETIWGQSFFDKYMPHQLAHFTDLGMYRDPGDPITYDLTTRLQCTFTLHAGATGPVAEQLDELLRTAGYATLLMVSPEGLVPFGGRSSQYNFQEAIVAALCEYEAKRWVTTDPQLAGAFKRQARLSVQAIEPWFAATPFRSLKNWYPPEDRHGFDPYGKYAVYSLLCASFCTIAASFADDTIAEQPCPAEIGGYVWELAPAFHKVIANTQTCQVIIDTCADPHYDATGLGRVTSTGCPIGLILGMPLSAEPAYVLADALTPTAPAAIGPEWQDAQGTWQRLAATAPDQALCTVHQHSPEQVHFSIQYDDILTEHYDLGKNTLQYHVTAAHPVRLVVPVLAIDGTSATSINIDNNVATVRLANHVVTYTFANDGATLELDERLQANRNGTYRLLTATNTASLTITMPATGSET